MNTMKLYKNHLNKENKHVLTISFNKEVLKVTCKNLLQVLKVRDYIVTNCKDELQTVVYDTINKTILYYSIF